MKLKIPNSNFNNTKERDQFAFKLAALLDPVENFVPVKPNTSDSRYYIIDNHNDWRLTFVEGSETDIVIAYRYQCSTIQQEEVLAGNICKTFNGIVIQ